jgi:hypothetical protein
VTRHGGYQPNKPLDFDALPPSGEPLLAYYQPTTPYDFDALPSYRIPAYVLRSQEARDATRVDLAAIARHYELPVDATNCPPEMLRAQADFYRADRDYSLACSAYDACERAAQQQRHERRDALQSITVNVQQSARVERAPRARSLPAPTSTPTQWPYAIVSLSILAIVLYCALHVAFL